MDYILVLIAVVLLAVDFCFNKLYQRRAGVSPTAGLFFNAIQGLFTGIIFFVLNLVMDKSPETEAGYSSIENLFGAKMEYIWLPILLATGMAVCGFIYILIGFKMMEKGSLATYTMFLMTGGMMIHFVFCLIFLGEYDGIVSLIFSVIGLLVMAAGVVAQNYSTEKKVTNKSLIALGAFVFLLNGCVSVFSKMHQFVPGSEKSTPVIQVPANWSDMTVNAEIFVMISGFVKFICCTIALIVVLSKNKKDFKELPIGKVLPVIALSAVASGTSYLFQLLGAAELNGTILYPLVTGGCIVFTALGGWLVYKEKPTKPLVVGMVLCVVGTLFFLRF
jgi:drug/metabolite transporter (DMT)-like permease